MLTMNLMMNHHWNLVKEKSKLSIHHMSITQLSILLKENSKPQDLIVYTDGSVTKDKSGQSPPKVLN